VAEKAVGFDVLGKRLILLDQAYEDINFSHLDAVLYFVFKRKKEGRILNGKFVKT